MSQFIIELSNGYQATGTFYNNPVADFFKRSLKHLQHIKVPIYQTDYLYYIPDRELIIKSFVESASRVGVTVQVNNLDTQSYLNELHVYYEKGYPADYNSHWLEYHELLHAIEVRNNNTHSNSPHGIRIDYRQYSGPLEESFDRKYMSLTVTELNPGVCYITWVELGKVPMQYWLDGEPNDQNRVCELAKPWITLKPNLMILFEKINLIPDTEKLSNFLKWFEPYQQAWMSKYNIDELRLQDYISTHVTLQGGKIPVAKLDNYQELDKEIASMNYVTKVKLT